MILWWSLLGRAVLITPFAALVIGSGPGGGRAADPDGPLFTRMASWQTGISFENRIQENDTLNVLEYEYFYNGGGVAVGDVNNDGLPDLYFTANMERDRLFLNHGALRFRDVSRRAKIPDRNGWTTGVTMADVNADGWLDIYVCRSGNGPEDTRRNLLLINNQDNTFSEEAKRYGLDDPSHSTHATFFDFDRDGDLDVFVVNHAVKRYMRFDVSWMKSQRDPLAGDKLYRNDGGHFVDVTVEAGIIGNPIGFGLSATASDVNQDGWTDIYVTNDYVEDDYLYINNGDGTFSEQIRDRLAHTSLSSMGSDIADFDNDGMPDILVLDMLPDDPTRRKLLKGPDGWRHYQQSLGYGYHHQFMRNTLQRNDGDGTFSEVGRIAGIASTDWSWSPLLADYDNDGWQDLLITNGYLRDYTNLDFLKSTMSEFFDEMRTRNRSRPLFELVKQMPRTVVRDHLFRNRGDLEFEDVSESWGIEEAHFTNGAAYADLDDDGDLDLVFNHLNEKAAIYRNESDRRSGRHFLKVRLSGAPGNPFGTGARVTVTTPDGLKHFREMIPSRGFQSSMNPVLHFGLGSAETVQLFVQWPDDLVQQLLDVSVDGTLVLDHADARPAIAALPGAPKNFVHVPEALGLDFVHRENGFIDFEREPLLPHMLSRLGPALAVGDVNGDLLQDVYVGGGRGQAAALYLQSADATFRSVQVPSFVSDRLFEDVDAVLFDADADGDADLFVVSGDSEVDTSDAPYQHRLYLNNGFGGFARASGLVPATTSSGGVVAAHDWDGDGDDDLFVGGRVVPGSYPRSPRSYLLENDGGQFHDVTHDVAPGLSEAGMIADALWADVTGNGAAELILAGEWTPVRVFSWTEAGRLVERTSEAGLVQTGGWWTSLAAGDLDSDGDVDIVAGNRGLNGLLSASREQPLEIVASDFNGNGRIEGIMAQGRSDARYPVPPRDLVLEALPYMEQRFPDYASFAEATMDVLLTPGERSGAVTLRVQTFASTLFENLGDGTFRGIPLATDAQVSPVTAIVVMDFDADGNSDVLLAGNDFGVHPDEGKFDAGRGLLLRGDGALGFEAIRSARSGFFAPLDVRAMVHVPTRRGSVIVVANNDDLLSVFGVIQQSVSAGGSEDRPAQKGGGS